MNRRKRGIVITLLLLLVLIVPPVWSVYREMRQARLDHALIEAIKARDDKQALVALAEGASGDARDAGEPSTFKEALLRLLAHIRHPGQAENQEDEKEHLPALLLLYEEEADLAYKIGEQKDDPGPDLSLIRSLLDHGANSNDKDQNGDTPLYAASAFANSDAVALLLQRGASPEAADKITQDTPLIWAAKFGRTDTIRVLLDHGANVNARDKEGQTALMWMPLEDVKGMRLLMQQGADVNAVDEGGQTILMEAARNGSVSTVLFLLRQRAKVGIKDTNGGTALDQAIGRSKEGPKNQKVAIQIAALLRKYGAK